MSDAFVKEYRIRHYETDVEKYLKPSQWLNYFQDAAICHGEQVGRGFDYLDNHDLLWVLMAWDIHVSRYPAYGESLIVHTMQHSSNGLYCRRVYKAKDDKGTLLAEGTSLWMMLQKSTFKVIKVPINVVSAYGGIIDRKNWRQAEKLQEASSYDGNKAVTIQVGINDLDSNRHVNNERYLDWVIRDIPMEVYGTHWVEFIKIQYLKSAFYKDLLLMETCNIVNDPGFTLKGRISNQSFEPCCLIELGCTSRGK